MRGTGAPPRPVATYVLVEYEPDVLQRYRVYDAH